MNVCSSLEESFFVNHQKIIHLICKATRTLQDSYIHFFSLKRTSSYILLYITKNVKLEKICPDYGFYGDSEFKQKVILHIAMSVFGNINFVSKIIKYKWNFSFTIFFKLHQHFENSFFFSFKYLHCKILVIPINYVTLKQVWNFQKRQSILSSHMPTSWLYFYH